MPASPKVGELATHRRSDIPQAMRIAILAIIIPMLLGGSLPASAAGKLDAASEAKLEKWFNYLSRLKEPAHFGALVAEAARFHVGSPYFHEPQPSAEPKSIDITLHPINASRWWSKALLWQPASSKAKRPVRAS